MVTGRVTARAGPRLGAVEIERAGVRLGQHWALRDISFRIDRGQRWLLIGGNGAGKTALLKLLRGDLWPTPTGRERRIYWLDDGPHAQPAAARERIAYVGPELQDKYERYGWNLRVADAVATGLFDTDLPLEPTTPGQARRVVAALADVGLAGLAKRRFLSLSYGQRRRVLLARALVRRPDLLLLDEVLNGLDRRSRAMFLRALRRFSSRRTAWMLSTHRAAGLSIDATHVAWIDGGRIVAQGPIDATATATTAAPARHAARRALAADGAPHDDAPHDDAPHDDAPSATAPETIRAAVAEPRSGTATRPGVLLSLRNVSLYRDYAPVITGLSLEVRAGEHWAVLGENGSGKSTLLAMLYGDLAPALGGRIVRGCTPGSPIADWKRDVGFVSPELQATYAATGCTLTEVVISGLHASIGLDDVPGADELQLARRWLARLGIASLGARRAREVSYGQLKRALIARALVRPRRLLLLDEPFDGLDDAGRSRVQALVTHAARHGTQVILATHHRDDLPGYVNRVLTLETGARPLITSRRRRSGRARGGNAARAAPARPTTGPGIRAT